MSKESNLANHLNQCMAEMEKIRVQFTDQENLPISTIISQTKRYMDLQNSAQFIDSMGSHMFPKKIVTPPASANGLKLIN